MQQHIELAGLAGPGAYQRGSRLAREHRVSVHTLDLDDGWVRGVVDGDTGVYRTETFFSRSRNGVLTSFDGDCTCPVSMDCKHAVALLLAALEDIEGAEAASSGARTPTRAPAWRETLQRALPTPKAPDVNLALAIHVTPPGQLGRFGYGFKDGRVTARPVRNGKRTRWVQSGVTWSNIRSGMLPGADPRQLAALARLHRIATADDRYYSDPNVIELDQVPLRELWGALAEVASSGVALIDPKSVGQGAPASAPRVQLEAEPAVAQLALTAITNDDDDDKSPALPAAVRVEARLEHPAIETDLPHDPILVGRPPHGVIWQDAAGNSHLAPLAEPAAPAWLALRDSGSVTVPPEDRAEFEREFAPRLAAHPWTSPDGSYEPPLPPEPVLHLGLRIAERGDPGAPPQAILAWGWGDVDNPYAPADTWHPLTPPAGLATAVDQDTGVDIVTGRNLRAEEEIRGQVAALLADTVPQALLRTSHDDRADLLPEAVLTGLEVVRFLELLPALGEAGVVVHHGDLPAFRAAAASGVTVAVAAESRDWFELEVSMEVAGHAVPIGQVIAALVQKQDTLFLPDGSYVSLDLPELEQLRQLLAESRALGDGRRSAIRVARINQSWWEELLALGVVQAAEQAWLAAVRRSDVQEKPPPLPAGLTATLRPYQREGFEWLASLRRAGLGGVLADDMGLGKTVQTLAMILDERNDNAERELPNTTPNPAQKKPWLVVAPTSVVPNWAAEAEKFAPELRVAVVNATGKRRAETLAEIAADADIIVTSYALLRLEAAEYESLDIAGLVLDEAQNVKNYTSKSFATVRKLRAPVTYAITGTPMENDLTELWAMFTLTAPGLLGNPQQFGEVYRRPIERGSPESSALLSRLRRRISPFLLRRTKEQVATDLPPKQEQVLHVDLAPAHRRIYDRHLQRERRRVLRLADDLEGNRVEVLAALTRLRQLAIDASLVEDDDDATAIPSSKLDVLLPLLREAAAEGHRVLVFSQFTRYLKKIAARLESEGLAYSYLDGTTTRRADVIQDFADGEQPVFLISLKAGGTGLNLTMADYAILADPWWNPAAEAQAVDRTHRIGQERPVMVYRLVSANTIEERVMALQEAKRALVAGVLDEDGPELAAAAAGKLSADDLRRLLA